MAIITAPSRDRLLAIALALVAAVMIHNLCGYLLWMNISGSGLASW